MKIQNTKLNSQNKSNLMLPEIKEILHDINLFNLNNKGFILADKPAAHISNESGIYINTKW